MDFFSIIINILVPLIRFIFSYSFNVSLLFCLLQIQTKEAQKIKVMLSPEKENNRTESFYILLFFRKQQRNDGDKTKENVEQCPQNQYHHEVSQFYLMNKSEQAYKKSSVFILVCSVCEFLAFFFLSRCLQLLYEILIIMSSTIK